MLGDPSVDQLSAMRFQRSQRADLAHAHEAAVSDYIGGQDSSKAALGAFFGHLGACFQRVRCGKVYERTVGESIGPHFRFGSIPEVPLSESDGRLQRRSGLEQAIQGRVHECTPYISNPKRRPSNVAAGAWRGARQSPMALKATPSA